MAQTESVRARLLEKANTLPLTPGVYLMRDRSGRVIYVGKSHQLLCLVIIFILLVIAGIIEPSTLLLVILGLVILVLL